MIEVKDVVKTFDGFRALDGVTMTVPRGAVYGLVGPNGAGKSTLIRHLTGIYRPDSGVIDIALSDRLPEGVRALAGILRTGLMNKTIDPFLRKIHAQDGSVKNDGTTPFTPDQLLHMDWLCDNVLGSIPSFEKILPISQPLVRELGIYRDSIPALKEASGHEDSGSL